MKFSSADIKWLCASTNCGSSVVAGAEQSVVDTFQAVAFEELLFGFLVSNFQQFMADPKDTILLSQDSSADLYREVFKGQNFASQENNEPKAHLAELLKDDVFEAKFDLTSIDQTFEKKFLFNKTLGELLKTIHEEAPSFEKIGFETRKLDSSESASEDKRQGELTLLPHEPKIALKELDNLNRSSEETAYNQVLEQSNITHAAQFQNMFKSDSSHFKQSSNPKELSDKIKDNQNNPSSIILPDSEPSLTSDKAAFQHWSTNFKQQNLDNHLKNQTKLGAIRSFEAADVDTRSAVAMSAAWRSGYDLNDYKTSSYASGYQELDLKGLDAKTSDLEGNGERRDRNEFQFSNHTIFDSKINSLTDGELAGNFETLEMLISLKDNIYLNLRRTVEHFIGSNSFAVRISMDSELVRSVVVQFDHGKVRAFIQSKDERLRKLVVESSDELRKALNRRGFELVELQFVDALTEDMKNFPVVEPAQHLHLDFTRR